MTNPTLALRSTGTYILAPVKVTTLTRFLLLNDDHIEVSGDDLAQYRAHHNNI